MLRTRLLLLFHLTDTAVKRFTVYAQVLRRPVFRALIQAERKDDVLINQLIQRQDFLFAHHKVRTIATEDLHRRWRLVSLFDGQFFKIQIGQIDGRTFR